MEAKALAALMSSSKELLGGDPTRRPLHGALARTSEQATEGERRKMTSDAGGPTGQRPKARWFEPDGFSPTISHEPTSPTDR